jgi:hypothetical protein
MFHKKNAPKGRKSRGRKPAPVGTRRSWPPRYAEEQASLEFDMLLGMEVFVATGLGCEN